MSLCLVDRFLNQVSPILILLFVYECETQKSNDHCSKAKNPLQRVIFLRQERQHVIELISYRRRKWYNFQVVFLILNHLLILINVFYANINFPNRVNVFIYLLFIDSLRLLHYSFSIKYANITIPFLNVEFIVDRSDLNEFYE